MGQERASRAIATIVNIENLTIYAVTEGHAKAASALSQVINLGFNDTVAYILMHENNIREIYSFDKDFDKLTEIKRISN